MATIATPYRPDRLYRYRRLPTGLGSVELPPGEDPVLQRELASIKDGYIYGANFQAMNDPMEGLFRPSSRINRIGDEKRSFRRSLMER